jgi:hypothetical protein
MVLLGSHDGMNCASRPQVIYGDSRNQKQNIYFQLQILTSEYITITLLRKSMHISSIFKLIALQALWRGSLAATLRL